MVLSKNAELNLVLSHPALGLVRFNNPVRKSLLNDSSKLSSYIHVALIRKYNPFVTSARNACPNVNLSDWLFLLYLSMFTIGFPSLASRPRMNSPLELVPRMVGGADNIR